jgi:hypothetical protein
MSESNSSSDDERSTDTMTYNAALAQVDTLTILQQMKLHRVLKKKLHKFYTKGIKEILLKYHPQDLDLIDDIIYIKPYYNDLKTGIITEPKIIFENGDVIYYSYEFGGGLYCYSKNEEGDPIPSDEKNILRYFGMKIYNTLINADILD